MTDVNAMAAPPFEKLRLVALARKISAGAIGEVRLRSPLHRMIPGVDSRHRRDRAEPSDRGIGDLCVVHDLGIIVHHDVVQDSSRADLAIGAKPGVVQFRRRIDGGFNRKYFASHANFHG